MTPQMCFSAKVVGEDNRSMFYTSQSTTPIESPVKTKITYQFPFHLCCIYILKYLENKMAIFMPLSDTSLITSRIIKRFKSWNKHNRRKMKGQLLLDPCSPKLKPGEIRQLFWKKGALRMFIPWHLAYGHSNQATPSIHFRGRWQPTEVKVKYFTPGHSASYQRWNSNKRAQYTVWCPSSFLLQKQINSKAFHLFISPVIFMEIMCLFHAISSEIHLPYAALYQGPQRRSGVAF